MAFDILQLVQNLPTEVQSVDVDTFLNPDPMDPDPTPTNEGTTDGGFLGTFQQFLNNLQSEYDVSLPIFDDIGGSVINIMLGKDVDLVRWNPDPFVWGKEIRPPAIPLGVYFGVSVSMSYGVSFGIFGDFDVGYSTRGLLDTGNLIDGIFLGDNASGGTDRLEAGFFAEGFLGAQANALGLIRVSIEGGPRFRLDMDVADVNHDAMSDPANIDGKIRVGQGEPGGDNRIYLDELGFLLGNYGPSCTFTVSGALDFFARGRVSLSIPFAPDPSITLFNLNTTLADFGDSCADATHVDLASIQGNSLVMHTDASTEEKTVRVSIVNGEGGVPEKLRISKSSPGSFAVEDFSLASLNGITSLVVEGTEGDDNITIDRTLTSVLNIPQITVNARGGDDDVEFGEIDAGTSHLLQTTVNAGNGNDSVQGTFARDVLMGGSGHDVLFGGDGDDHLDGSFGRDVLNAGAGNNTVVGGGSSDELTVSGNGMNTLDGGSGDDQIIGANGIDNITGGAGADRIYGLAGADTINGGSGNDFVSAGPGDDTILGGTGADELHGDEGEDSIQGGSGNDLIYGGDGADTTFGDVGNDTIYGGGGDDITFGDDGNDTIYGGYGMDQLDGGDGDDVIFGQHGNDFLFGQDGNDRLVGQEGDDYFEAGEGDDIVDGGTGDDLLVQSANFDQALTDSQIIGLGTNSHRAIERFHLVGGASDNRFDVGGWTGGPILVDGLAGLDGIAASRDTDFDLSDNSLAFSTGERFSLTSIETAFLSGGSLDNHFDLTRWSGVAGLLDGANGLDQLVYRGQGDATVTDAGFSNSSGMAIGLSNIEEAHLTGDGAANILDASGFSGTAILFGRDGNDQLLGGTGDDLLDGGRGIDFIQGGDGNDELFGGGGAGDQLDGEAGDDIIHGSQDGADIIQGGSGHDVIFAYAGNDVIDGGAGDDQIEGGPGDDVISGGPGSDLLLGGADHDILYGHSVTESGDDLAVDYVYGDFGTDAEEVGSGADQVFGGGGSDLLFGEGGADFIDAGSGLSDLVDYGHGSATPEGFVPPAPTAAPALLPDEGPIVVASNLADGSEYVGLWREINGSATGDGVSGSAGHSVEPSVAIHATDTYVAWSDNRNGDFDIHVALRTTSGWEDVSGTRVRGSVWSGNGDSLRPSLIITAAGDPVVAWTEQTGTGSNIYAARFDATANGGLGDWVALGNSLTVGGISGTGEAKGCVLLDTTVGLIVAWIDHSSGVANVYAKRFNGVSWVEYGSGAASGGGLSMATANVEGLALATDGTHVAAAWSQDVAGTSQVYLKEHAGVDWMPLAGSATAGGVSNTAGHSATPAVAYHAGNPILAWQDQTSGSGETFATRYDGSMWQPVGQGGTLRVSSEGAMTSQPQLVMGGGELRLAWVEDLVANKTGNRLAIYVMRWDSNLDQFTEELPGDASYRGVSQSGGAVQSLSLAHDSNGVPTVAWTDLQEAGRPEVYVRTQDNVVGTVYYINDPFSTGDRFAQEIGKATNDGLSALTPAISIQQIIDSYALIPGDVVMVDTGIYSLAANVGSGDTGFLIYGADPQSAEIKGQIVLTGTSNVVLQQLNLSGGVELTGAHGITLLANHIGGSGVLVDDSDTATVVHNTISTSGTGVELTGGADGTVMEHNIVHSAETALLLDGGGATNAVVRRNELQGDAVGIEIQVPSTGEISENRVRSTMLGLDLSAVFTGPVARNKVSGAAVGIRYAVPSELSGNQVFGNTLGIDSLIVGTVGVLGSVGAESRNNVFHNETGVRLLSTMQNQHVHHNVVGVQGVGTLGGLDFTTANLIEANSLGLHFDGDVQFQRITRNTIGLRAHDYQQIAHNLFYDNDQIGIDVDGQHRVDIVNNTFWTTGGTQIRIEGNATEIEIRNNILWTESGYNLFVDNDSLGGFYSDYNTLHAGDSGFVAHWVQDFSDILDWQEDVNRFDLHSIGKTLVNPAWSRPRFQSPLAGDYQILDVQAKQRFSSPTIDAADPLGNHTLPSTYQNLLANAGFEAGLSSWTTNSGAGVRSGNPAAYDQTSYFAGGSASVAFAEQTIDLIANGFTVAELDSQDLVAIFGGRARSLQETILDLGQFAIIFLDAIGTPIGTSVETDPSSTTERWNLIGERVAVPAGTRQIRVRYRSTHGPGGNGNQDAYLDAAFLYLIGDNVSPDQGAYGNTDHGELNTTNGRIALRWPDLYTDWEATKSRTIRWETYGNSGEAQVVIGLYQDTPSGPNLIAQISAGTADDGEFEWSPLQSGVGPDTHDLRIQVSLSGSPMVVDRSAEVFSVPEDTDTFFVNDDVTLDDEYTTTIGSNRNTGRLASAPKPNLLNVLRIYQLQAGDDLFVDTGDYPSLFPILVSNQAEFGNDEGFSLSGPTDANRSATIAHAVAFLNEPVIELRQADAVTLENLTLVNGKHGLLIQDGSDDFVGRHLEISGHSDDGLRITGVSRVKSLDSIEAFNNGGEGIDVSANLVDPDASDGRGTISNSTVYGNQNGIVVSNAGMARVEGNVVRNNSLDGVRLSGTSNAIVTGNLVHDNGRSGIVVPAGVSVLRNAVFGHTGQNAVGIQITGLSTAAENVIYLNRVGVNLSNGGKAEKNRIYANTTGIRLTDSSQATGNVVYSNSTGVDGYSLFTGQLVNNLIYANSAQAVVLATSIGPDIENNTIYQTSGDAIRLKSGTRDVTLRNNVIWVQSGYAVNVDNDSQNGFQSDYNLLYATNTGQVALWQDRDRADLASWRSATFNDTNSLTTDPLFVDILGPDAVLGYDTLVNDGRDDDFHLSSTIGRFVGSLAPVADFVTGLPTDLAIVELVDATRSPAIDRGDPESVYANEPGTNGGFVNLGAYGNTAQASKSPAEFVLVTSPDGGESWPADRVFDIQWRSHDFASTVDIELLELGNPSPIETIAVGVLNTGTYSWLIPTTVPPSTDYFIRVTRAGGAAPVDASNGVFQITEPISDYFVNDGSLVGDEYSLAIGNDANSGLHPSQPKSSVRAILEAYDLGPGDRILVDTGVYDLGANIVVGENVGLGLDDAGVTIQGPLVAGHEAVLNRGNTGSSSYVFELVNADDVTLRNLTITGGRFGVSASSGSDSDGVTIADSVIRDNGDYGISFQSGGTNLTIIANTIRDNANTGIYVLGDGLFIQSNTISGHNSGGIWFIASVRADPDQRRER